MGEWFVTSGGTRRLLDPDDKDTTILLNVRKYMQDSTVSLLRRSESSATLL